jgi:hypothetical protein
MSDQDLQNTNEAMARLQQDLTSSPEKALEFLVEAGIVTPLGKLTEPYQHGA